MNRIGIIDIDTSHPENWIPIERELGYEVVGFYDHGTVRTSEYADDFAKKHQLTRFHNQEELAKACDILVIHSCNWDRHIEIARPLVEAGKSVLIDKPIAGTLKDLHTLVDWEFQGARVTGGSCQLFADEIVAYQKRVVKSPELRAHTVFAGCGVDEFNYGIHAFSVAFSLLGFDWDRVRTASVGAQQVIHVLWKNGTQAVITVGKNSWLPTHVTLIGQSGVEQFTLSIEDPYRPILKATLPYLSGKEDRPPILMSHLIQPEVCALASFRSRAQQGRWVSIEEMATGNERYDGFDFNRKYRLAVQGA